MNTTDALRQIRATAEEMPAKAASARAALNQMRRRAVDFTDQAHSRARGEIYRRRSTAADTLEDLAGALRPARGSRRRTMAIAGGSGLAITAVLGLGVALGFVVSRELKKRADLREADKTLDLPASMPQATPTAAALDL
jgi:Flp pilus assembly protein TadB